MKVASLLPYLSPLVSLLALVTSISSIVFGEWRYRTSFKLAWYKEVVSWARECVQSLSSAHEICASHNKDIEYIKVRRSEILEKITSLIDEGRFVFENDRDNDHGRDKPYAYQGYRPDLMDYLLITYNILSKIDPGDGEIRPQLCAELIDQKREFVSDIQKIIQPNWFSRQAIVTPNKIS